MKNTENIVKINVSSFQDMCKQIVTLTEENNKLNDELTHFKARNLSLAQRCRELSQENMEIKSELADVKFMNKVIFLDDDNEKKLDAVMAMVLKGD